MAAAEAVTTALKLWDEFHGPDALGQISEFAFQDLPKGQYSEVSISELNINNPKNLNLDGSTVWYPTGQFAAMKNISFSIKGASKDCSFFFLRVPKALSIYLNGDCNKLLCLSSGTQKASITMTTPLNHPHAGSRVIMGEGGYMAGVRMALMNTDVVIKKDTLWSDDILVQGANSHVIIDLPSQKISGEKRQKIVVNEHVWIGRRSVLMQKADIGKGSILGTAAVATKKYPEFRAIVGNPGVVVGGARTWLRNYYNISETDKQFLANHSAPDLFIKSQEVVRRPSWLSFLKRILRRVIQH